MCGVVFVKGKDCFTKADYCLNKIKHRGPDNFSIVTVDDISLGFARLSINDKTNKGNQPFETQNYIGAFNTEIYNYKYLIEKYKLNVKSDCDAEVILLLFEIFKYKIIHMLDGFFSGVILQKNTKTIFVIKDYIGKKPLFLAETKDNLYIVSELKALKDYTNFIDIPKGVSIINKNLVKIKENHIKQFSIDLSVENVYNTLYKSVKKRIAIEHGDKIGIFLSGGIDSSIVSYLAHILLPYKKIMYYYLAEKNSKDLIFINKFFNYFNIKNENICSVNFPDKKTLEHVLKKVVYSTESINPSIISNGIGSYILSQKAHNDGIKVILTGDGADEMFLGYFDNNTPNIHKTWKSKRERLINDLCFTELRRLDLTCMANSIESRCPFLDKEIYNLTNSFDFEKNFGNTKNCSNKFILREAFKNKLPIEIYKREKMPFDVGSGLQEKIINLAKDMNLDENDYLSKIWDLYFEKSHKTNKKDKYFSEYPMFDKLIKQRDKKYKIDDN